MGYPQGHKEQTRQRIIQAARRLWKRRGYGGASVDKVMEEANLTRGGFYAHFKSKDDLLTEVLSETLAVTTIERLRQEGVTDEKDLKKRILDFYISEQHCAFPEQGCPLTSLAQEGARFGKGPRRVLSRVVNRF
jgi:TetR/AcrR family transcriptional repressor of nem operon